jgi:hypothetical protein
MAFRVEISPRALNDPDEIVEYIKQRGSFEQAEKWSCAAEYSRVSSEAPETPVRSGDRLCAIIGRHEDPHLRTDRLRVNSHQPQTQSRVCATEYRLDRERHQMPSGTSIPLMKSHRTAGAIRPDLRLMSWCKSPFY